VPDWRGAFGQQLAGHARRSGYDRIFMPLPLKQIYLDKSRQEDLLRSSAARFTIVRPGFLNDDSTARPYRLVHDRNGVRSDAISRAQVAQFIVAVIEQESQARQTLLLGR
jgi:uncharacterized protein YbjT (DUF2867 family)